MTQRIGSLAAPLRLPLAAIIATSIAAIAAAGCAVGPSVSGSFDRTLTVTAPIRLELSNASGDVSITGSSDGKVHVHGEVRSSGMSFDNPQKRLDEMVSNPRTGARDAAGRAQRRAVLPLVDL